MERTELNKKIGQNIRKYRLKIDISQENLAMSAGLYPAYLGRLERGEKCPTIDTLYKISCALGITINELICFDSKINSSPTNNQAKMRIEEALKQIPDTQQLRIAEILCFNKILWCNENYVFICSGEHGSPIDLCANTNQAKPIFLVNSKYKFHITNDLY